jgi:hypothetical protein
MEDTFSEVMTKNMAMEGRIVFWSRDILYVITSEKNEVMNMVMIEAVL